ncbi:MAG: hypothetical protein ACRBN8_11955 [Nannocystales bacterium]
MSTQIAALLLATLTAGAPARASLDVDASALGEAGPAVGERLTTRGERVLRDADILPGTDPSDALISIRLDTLPDAVGYRYAYTVTRDGELVEGTRGAAECRLCSEAELTEQLDVAITRLAARLQPVDTPEPSEPVVAPAPVVVPTPSNTEPVWRVGPMGGTGIVLTGVGGLALGLGAGLAIAEPVLVEGNADRSAAVSVAGLAVAVAGVALASTGVALMLVERSRSRRRTQAHWQGTTLYF